MELTSITEYKSWRIHTSRLESGTWVASIVAHGGIVQHVPGEFSAHDQALEAAQRHIGQNTENGK